MSILVVGGAGYIGSHTVDCLIEKGRSVVVVDNLSTGHRAAVADQAVFYEGDIRDKDFLAGIFEKEPIDSVIHFAANSLVGESMEKPLKYFDNNIGGMISLLEIMQDFSIKRIVFSSTAATYGIPEHTPILESDPQVPIGESKLAIERIIHWADEAYGIRFVALRYFNVAGAKPDGSIGEDHHPETHLIPVVMQVALGKRPKLMIFGDDYDTSDSTNIRDYAHVTDLADTHILAVDYLVKGGKSDCFNLGSATGYSVKQILGAAREATGKEIPAEVGPRRTGDPATLVAASVKAREILHWEPNFDDIHEIIRTAWNWHQKHPRGYQDKEKAK
ncbi:UDP-glucose 4-epimerase GalE [Sporolactobacillus pectinivorans]|uniref:UDP-glucose 4-epimerase GalE n=1 Tax=Sporolactobacillus pectinivorans TaxID=1591408 RepID=UPI000C2589A0|nr:UDP-glucose 4-epimerase GalE [Sporolactobacillus pectinivorans]